MSAASHPLPAPVKQQPTLAPKPTPTKPKSGGPWKWILALVVAAVIAFVAYRATNKPAPTTPVVAVRTAKVTSGNLAKTVRVAGQTTAMQFANITAPMMQGPDANREMILLSTATPGSWVKKGTLIASIDSQSMQDHVDDLGDTIQAARADIDKRKAEQSIEWENLQQTLRITKSEVEKAQLDYKVAEVRTDVERQLLKLSLDEAEARYKQAQADVDLKKQSQASEIRILEYTLERHTRHRNRHVNDVKAFSIYAPMDGLVVMATIFRNNETAQVQAGDRLFPGQSFMKVVNSKQMQVEGNINQAESSLFRVGQKATVKFDAFPGMQFDAEVYTLGALAAGGYRQSAFIRNVPIRIRIAGNDPRLIPDLSASADVVLDRANGTMVPRSALRTEDGKYVAYVKKGPGFERREVEIGLQNDTHAIALAGLGVGDEVRLN